MVGLAVTVLRANVLFVDHRLERFGREPLPEIGHELSARPNLRNGQLPDNGQPFLQRAFRLGITRAMQGPICVVVPRPVPA